MPKKKETPKPKTLKAPTVAEAEERLDEIFCKAFGTNDPPMLDWVMIKFELKRLRQEIEVLKYDGC